jgi:hypothetical protein
MEHPTLLRVPGPPPMMVEERILSLAPEAYQVSQTGAWWVVTVVATGDEVYRGPGPVEVLRSRAPF